MPQSQERISMTNSHSRTGTVLGVLLLLTFAMLNSGCAKDSYAAKGAAEGAQTGAIAGAVGGMVTAMIFGGNVLEAGRLVGGVPLHADFVGARRWPRNEAGGRHELAVARFDPEEVCI